MKSFRFVFVVVSLLVMSFFETGCSSAWSVEFLSSHGTQRLCEGGTSVQMPRFGNYDENGNYTLNTANVVNREIIIINRSGYEIDIFNGVNPIKSGVKNFQTTSIKAFVSSYYGGMDVNIIIDIINSDENGDRKILQKAVRRIHLSGGSGFESRVYALVKNPSGFEIVSER